MRRHMVLFAFASIHCVLASAQTGAVMIVKDISSEFHKVTSEATKEIKGLTDDIKNATNDILKVDEETKKLTDDIKKNMGETAGFMSNIANDAMSLTDPIAEIADMTCDAVESDVGGAAMTQFKIKDEYENYRSQFEKYKSVRAKIKTYSDKFDQYRKLSSNLKSKNLNESNMQIAEALQASQAADEKNHQEAMGAANMQLQSISMEWKQKKAEKDAHDKFMNSEVSGIGGGSFDYFKTKDAEAKGGSYYEME